MAPDRGLLLGQEGGLCLQRVGVVVACATRRILYAYLVPNHGCSIATNRRRCFDVEEPGRGGERASRGRGGEGADGRSESHREMLFTKLSCA